MSELPNGIIGPTSPCTAEVIPGEHGGLTVKLHVPTYSGGQTFTLTAERDGNDGAAPDGSGDWRVYLPWPDDAMQDELVVIEGVEVANGVAYLGAPDVMRSASSAARPPE